MDKNIHRFGKLKYHARNALIIAVWALLTNPVYGTLVVVSRSADGIVMVDDRLEINGTTKVEKTKIIPFGKHAAFASIGVTGTENTTTHQTLIASDPYLPTFFAPRPVSFQNLQDFSEAFTRDYKRAFDAHPITVLPASLQRLQ